MNFHARSLRRVMQPKQKKNPKDPTGNVRQQKFVKKRKNNTKAYEEFKTKNRNKCKKFRDDLKAKRHAKLKMGKFYS